MFELVLLGLFGSAAIATMMGSGLGDGSDDTDEMDDDPIEMGDDIIDMGGDDDVDPEDDDVVVDMDEDDVVVEPETDPDQTLRLNGQQTVTGGSGNDTLIDIITGYDYDEDLLVAVEMGDGNDVVDLTDQYYADAQVYGGAGDDTLTMRDSIESGNALFGGDGNDTITADDGIDSYGGAGDDVLDGPAVSDFRFNQGRDVYGGDGDDLLKIYRSAGSGSVTPDEDRDGEFTIYQDRHFGGEGADTFELSLGIADEHNASGDDIPETEQQRVLVLTDFTAGEDALVINQVDIDQGPNDNRVLLSTEIIPHPLYEGQSRLVLQYGGVEAMPVLDVYIDFQEGDVTLDDIVINQNS